MLWKEEKYNPDSDCNWEEDNSGFTQIIGYINENSDMPVNLSFMFAKIYGVRICFIDPVSRFVDHQMVREYIEKYYPVYYDTDKLAYIKSSNFHHALNACKENKFLVP